MEDKDLKTTQNQDQTDIAVGDMTNEELSNGLGEDEK